ncbi:hypothetical protein [Malacoplasma iowae]|uniref:hypothetical protein n=1 Tax=Malacoplasma iowae TaxID=2116 RepID=UPI00130226B6|nr:hypothetical protein [Malacoplasma iowae]
MCFTISSFSFVLGSSKKSSILSEELLYVFTSFSSSFSSWIISASDLVSSVEEFSSVDSDSL